MTENVFEDAEICINGTSSPSPTQKPLNSRSASKHRQRHLRIGGCTCEKGDDQQRKKNYFYEKKGTILCWLILS